MEFLIGWEVQKKPALKADQLTQLSPARCQGAEERPRHAHRSRGGVPAPHRAGTASRAGRPWASGTYWFAKLAKLANFAFFFANFWRARSRLYQNEILQENMRLTAFFKLYKICILLHRCNLKFFAKNRFEKLRINFSQNFRKFWQILLTF